MSVNIGTLLAKIMVDTKGLQRSTKTVTSATDNMSKGFKKTQKSATGLSTALKTLAGAATILSGIKLANTFIDAAAEAENFSVRLNVIFKSVEKGNELFQDMATYASQVPFEFNKVLGGATQLAGVMKGGIKEINTWMPLIGDLAAVTGLDIKVAMGQFIRMYSAGAQAADMFRERGILNMMGFRAGVRYTAEETKRMMMDAWNKVGSKFKGATAALAKTWIGIVSMMKDAWFLFRMDVMNSGPFQVMKDKLGDFVMALQKWRADGTIRKWAEEAGEAILMVVSSLKALLKLVAIGTVIWMLPALAKSIAFSIGLINLAILALPGFGFASLLVTQFLVLDGIVLGVVASIGLIGAALAGILTGVGLYIIGDWFVNNTQIGKLTMIGLGDVVIATFNRIKYEAKSVGLYIAAAFNPALAFGMEKAQEKLRAEFTKTREQHERDVDLMIKNALKLKLVSPLLIRGKGPKADKPDLGPDAELIKQAKKTAEKMAQLAKEASDDVRRLEVGVFQFKIEQLEKFYNDSVKIYKALGKDTAELTADYMTALGGAFELKRLEQEAEALKKTKKAYAEMMQEGAELTESMRTSMEVYFDSLARYRKLLDGAFISQETFNRAVAELNETWYASQEQLEEYNRTMDVLNKQLAKGIILYEEYNKAANKALKEAADGTKKMTSMMEALIFTVEGFALDATDAFADWMDGAEGGFTRMINSMIDDLKRMLIYEELMKPLFEMFSGVLKGGGANSPGGTVFGDIFNMGKTGLGKITGMFGFAEGGLANISQHKNSLVTSPTAFTFANGMGIMGEAGTEAIMPTRGMGNSLSVGAMTGGNEGSAPLGRLSNGDLGVDLEGLGGGISITNNWKVVGRNPEMEEEMEREMKEVAENVIRRYS